MLEFAVGIFFGCIAGVAAMCMVVTAGREDERLELYEQMRNLENRKPIQFINEKKEPVFTVLDGGGIKLIAPDGETQISNSFNLPRKWKREESYCPQCRCERG